MLALSLLAVGVCKHMSACLQARLVWNTTADASENVASVVAPTTWADLEGGLGPVAHSVDMAGQHARVSGYIHTMGNFTGAQLLAPRDAVADLHRESKSFAGDMDGVATLIEQIESAMSGLQLPAIGNYTPPRSAAATGAGMEDCGASAPPPDTAGLQQVDAVFSELTSLRLALNSGAAHVSGMQTFMVAALQAQYRLSELPSQALAAVGELQSVVSATDSSMHHWLDTFSVGDLANLTAAVAAARDIVVPSLHNATRAGMLLPDVVAVQNTSLDNTYSALALLDLDSLDTLFDTLATLGDQLPAGITVGGHMKSAVATSSDFNTHYVAHFRDENYNSVVQALKDEADAFAGRVSDLLARARAFRGILGMFAAFIGDLPGIGGPAAAMTDFVLSLVDDALSVATRIDGLLQRAASMTDLEARVRDANTLLEYLATNATLADAVEDELSQLNARIANVWEPARDVLSLAVTWKQASSAVSLQSSEVLAHVRQYQNGTAVASSTSVTLRDDLRRALQYDKFVISALVDEVARTKLEVDNATSFSPSIDHFTGFKAWRSVATEVTAVDLVDRLEVVREATAALLRDQTTLTTAIATQHCVPSIECARDRFLLRLQELKALAAELIEPLRRGWHSTSVARSSATVQADGNTNSASPSVQGPQALVSSAQRLYMAQIAVEMMVQRCNNFITSTRPTLRSHALLLMPASQHALEFVHTTLPFLQTRVGDNLMSITQVADDTVGHTQAFLEALTTAYVISSDITVGPTLRTRLSSATTAIPAAQFLIDLGASDAMERALGDLELLAVPARIFAVFSEAIDAVYDVFEFHLNLLNRLRAAIVGFHADVQGFLSDLEFAELKSGPLASVQSLAPACDNSICLRVYPRSPDIYRKVVFPIRFLRFCSLGTPALFSLNKVSWWWSCAFGMPVMHKLIRHSLSCALSPMCVCVAFLRLSTSLGLSSPDSSKTMSPPVSFKAAPTTLPAAFLCVLPTPAKSRTPPPPSRLSLYCHLTKTSLTCCSSWCSRPKPAVSFSLQMLPWQVGLRYSWNRTPAQRLVCTSATTAAVKASSIASSLMAPHFLSLTRRKISPGCSVWCSSPTVAVLLYKPTGSILKALSPVLDWQVAQAILMCSRGDYGSWNTATRGFAMRSSSTVPVVVCEHGRCAKIKAWRTATGLTLPRVMWSAIPSSLALEELLSRQRRRWLCMFLLTPRVLLSAATWRCRTWQRFAARTRLATNVVWSSTTTRCMIAARTVSSQRDSGMMPAGLRLTQRHLAQ